jgi:lipopolysaccharide transport system ATP-binding protein
MITDNNTISVEIISKCYRIGLKEQINENLVGAVMDYLKSPVRNFRKYRSLYNFTDASGPEKNSEDIYWALQDISFTVQQGEVLGVIGKNGAGKSTLLKILCKITEPTSGRVEIRGRVSSLLEVGTGFHPELTGRENVYLNATILGMKKKEVDRKFDEIVEFSGIAKFIDTPVKRYSSGMSVRLAFSVAAHLEPEILIIDEVLAVGDAEFQQKCMGRMEHDAKQGRTILLVSHNMSAITNLCTRAIYLERGKVKLNGSPSVVVNSYLSSNTECVGIWSNALPMADELEVWIKSAAILSVDNEYKSIVEFDKKFAIEVVYEIFCSVKHLCILCRLTDFRGNVLWTSWDTDIKNWNDGLREPGLYHSKCIVPQSFTRPGRYYVSIGAMVSGVKLHAFHENILTFDVSEVGYHLNMSRIGLVTPLLEWEIKRQ